jgi:hypothetical protein
MRALGTAGPSALFSGSNIGEEGKDCTGRYSANAQATLPQKTLPDSCVVNSTLTISVLNSSV